MNKELKEWAKLPLYSKKRKLCFDGEEVSLEEAKEEFSLIVKYVDWFQSKQFRRIEATRLVNRLLFTYLVVVEKLTNEEIWSLILSNDFWDICMGEIYIRDSLHLIKEATY